MTLSNLAFGTTVLYNDQANTDFRFTVIGYEEDQFGKWVEVITENGNIELMKAHTKIDGNRYAIA
jgi:hypothetical protein